MPMSLRALFAVAAIGMLFERSPWTQPNPVQMAAALGGPLFFGLIASFGYRTGWPRALTLTVGIVMAAIVLAKLAGFAV